ncbi:hypothetical protein LPAF129_09770 [Ligilactobacillus pabuli]|uniref:Integrase catalytic domain-containing protein n=1 Tax=Ligilactobacillus pabuli TaxID=2886039 RepID=A0ABQ5JGU3_9LACO|nr:hypothetical protein LPAF129_09770 [Ligilactobacillus pabuli]
MWINLYIWRFQQLSGTLRCDIQHGSRPGTPYDNAPMEYWWNEFKSHWMEYQTMPTTFEETVKLLKKVNHYNRLA